MRYRMFYALLVLCLWSRPSLAVTQDTFLIRYTQDLIELCSAPESDPLYAEAISFCHGYLIGAYHYQVALQADPKEKPLFCLPNPAPTRQQGIQMFISWAKQNQQYMGEKAVDTIARFLSTQWPCK
jgi:Ssp1 endopeptidase immunity protein Rap1a